MGSPIKQYVVSQNKGRFLLVVATPDSKLIWLDLRTKQCCHEHAGEIFIIYPATCETIKIILSQAMDTTT